MRPALIILALLFSTTTAAAQAAPPVSQTPNLVPGVSYPAAGASAELSIDAETYEDAIALRRQGTGLMITGGVFGLGGVVALITAGLSYGAQNVCISPSGTCERDVEAPIAALAVGGGALFLGLTLILVGAVQRGAANEILASPVSVSVNPNREGATLELTGTF